MGTTKVIAPIALPFSFRRLSIRQQLPLLICLLLLTVILLFGSISYIGIRRAAEGIGQERLRTLTEELSSMFRQQARTMSTATQAAANKEEIVNYLQQDPQHPPSPAPALAAMHQLLTDSQNVRIELRDTQGRLLLYTGRDLNGSMTRTKRMPQRKWTEKTPPGGRMPRWRSRPKPPILISSENSTGQATRSIFPSSRLSLKTDMPSGTSFVGGQCGQRPRLLPNYHN